MYSFYIFLDIYINIFIFILAYVFILLCIVAVCQRELKSWLIDWLESVLLYFERLHRYGKLKIYSSYAAVFMRVIHISWKCKLLRIVATHITVIAVSVLSAHFYKQTNATNKQLYNVAYHGNNLAYHSAGSVLRYSNLTGWRWHRCAFVRCN